MKNISITFISNSKNAFDNIVASCKETCIVTTPQFPSKKNKCLYPVIRSSTPKFGAKSQFCAKSCVLHM